MVRAIGFRVEPQTVNYAVVEGTKQQPILIFQDKMSPPNSYDKESSQLVWYRERLLTIIEEYQPQFAAIRLPEPSSFKTANKDSLLKRARIEGVILEGLGKKGIECMVAALTTISKKRYSSAIELADALARVTIPLDWNTQFSPNGEIFWKASQGKQKSDLVVELVKGVENLWNVNVFTENQGNRRKKSQHCKQGLTRSHAETHLENTFTSLSLA
ncbi:MULTISPECIES: hypothetical protein [unclassified Anabaena]|uniref:hypothetical protein n=1 Tax=unclassified Anabaena TaxID=2619674 RepID=UPI0006AC9DE7|nr:MULTISPECIES: hypothetical protein [unclassified Anabaena]ALB43108.1 hypothetical protein AA650_23990 [Anabaena sp. WA102]OBQ16105.1 MAG: hypothetical protein AN486_20275 [Anabaena sp. AL93]